jgi:hypothetical protein
MANLSYMINKNLNGAVKGVAIADNTAFPPCVAVNCTTAGALTVTWLDDTTSSYYFSQGTSGNVIQIKQVGTGAAAAGLVALYNT